LQLKNIRRLWQGSYNAFEEIEDLNVIRAIIKIQFLTLYNKKQVEVEKYTMYNDNVVMSTNEIFI